MRIVRTIACLLTSCALMTNATALTLAKFGPPGSSNLVTVHDGCHYDCEFSPRLGWHNHSNANCRPEQCRTQQRDDEDGEMSGRRHSCHYDCRYNPQYGWHNHSNSECRVERCDSDRH